MEDLSPDFHLAEIMRRLHCSSRQVRNFVADRIRPSHLSDSEFLLLWVCHEQGNEPTVQGHVVARIGLSPAQLSGLVDRLHKRGLLQVERSDRDRRRQLLQLTDSGTAVFRQAKDALDACSRQMSRHIKETQVKQLTELAQLLVDACQQIDEWAQSDRGTTSATKGAAA